MTKTFELVVNGLLNGDFTDNAPHFKNGLDSDIAKWFDEGRFADHQEALEEAFTCACWLGETTVADHLVTNGVDPEAGNRTGMDALHWAANRGQAAAVRLLLRNNVSTETVNQYGGTALGAAVWAALNEPRDGQIECVELLLENGADLEAAHIADLGFPTGNKLLDQVLARYVTLNYD